MIHHYDPKKFTLESLKTIWDDLWNKYQSKERTMKLYTSEDNMEYINAASSGNKERLNNIQEKISKKIALSQAEYQKKFLMMYNGQLYDFMTSIMPKNWLNSGSTYYTVATWSYICDDEYSDYNDDSYRLYFSKGKFYIKMDIAGGYIDSKNIEENYKKVDMYGGVLIKN